MKIFVKAKPNASRESIEITDAPTGRAGDKLYTVSVREPPANGLANLAIVKVLAEHFKTTRSNVRILKGHTSKQKIVEILI